jgi:uridine phosphorylase
MQRAGVLSIEMEAATLFVVGRLHGVRTGCILALREEWADDGSRIQAGPQFEKGLDQVIRIAFDAVRLLESSTDSPSR